MDAPNNENFLNLINAFNNAHHEELVNAEVPDVHNLQMVSPYNYFNPVLAPRGTSNAAFLKYDMVGGRINYRGERDLIEKQRNELKIISVIITITNRWNERRAVETNLVKLIEASYDQALGYALTRFNLKKSYARGTGILPHATNMGEAVNGRRSFVSLSIGTHGDERSYLPLIDANGDRVYQELYSSNAPIEARGNLTERRLATGIFNAYLWEGNAFNIRPSSHNWTIAAITKHGIKMKYTFHFFVKANEWRPLSLQEYRNLVFHYSHPESHKYRDDDIIDEQEENEEPVVALPPRMATRVAARTQEIAVQQNVQRPNYAQNRTERQIAAAANNQNRRGRR